MVKSYRINKIIILVWSIIFLVSCSTTGSFEIKNAGKDTVITILANSTPTNVLLYVTGEVDDSFMVNSAPIKGGSKENQNKN